MTEILLESEYVDVEPFDSMVEKVGAGQKVPRRTISASEDWLQFAEKQLRAIENLRPNWDSYGAAKPEPQILSAGLNLLRSIASAMAVPKPYIYPTPNGGVQFEWECDGRYLEIDLIDAATAEYFFDDKNSKQQREGLLFYGQPLGEVIAYLEAVVGTG